jgi:regulatory protein
MHRQTLTKEQAFEKAKYFCAYQERCHSEAREKLYSLGLNKKEGDEMLAQLIEEGFINEERFAERFAGGRFRLKQWGKIKINYELKQKGISAYCIKKALAAIDERDYLKTARKLLQEKMKTVASEKNIFIKKKKLYDHLSQKGFESGIIASLMKDML